MSKTHQAPARVPFRTYEVQVKQPNRAQLDRYNAMSVLELQEAYDNTAAMRNHAGALATDYTLSRTRQLQHFAEFLQLQELALDIKARLARR